MFLLASIALAAAAPAGVYHAEPVAPPAQARLIARENVWRCTAGACTSPRNGTRAPIVCATLVREVGALRSFAVDGQPFTAEQLQGCNRRAQ